MKKFLILIAVIFVAYTTYANNKNEKRVEKTDIHQVTERSSILSITGSIVDNKNNESLAGAAIYVDGNKYYSDLNGNFSVSHLAPGKYLLRIELISYQPTEMEVEIDSSKNINIVLNQQ